MINFLKKHEAACMFLIMSPVFFKPSSVHATNAYVTNTSGINVSVIDTTSNVVIATVPVGNSPQAVAITPDRSKAYVTNFSLSNISVIDTASNLVLATIQSGNPWGIAITPDGSRAYAVNFSVSSQVNVINTANNLIVATIPVGLSPINVAITPDGSRAYVANQSVGSVSVINTASNLVVATIPVGTQPYAVAITPDGSRAYVPNRVDNNVSVINTTTNLIVATIMVGSNPQAVAVAPDGSSVYVANTFSTNVSVINTANNLVTATITVGSGPNGVAFTEDGSSVYITNVANNSVSVINTASNLVVATIPAGLNPRGIAILPIPPALPPSPPSPSTPPLGSGFNLTGNQASLASYLQSLSSLPAINSILADLNRLDSSQLAAALNSISPARNGIASYLSSQVAFGFGEMASSYLFTRRVMSLSQKRGGQQQQSITEALNARNEALSFISDSDDPVLNVPADLASESDFDRNPSGHAQSIAAGKDNWSFWESGFGDFIFQEGQNQNPAVRDISSGAILKADFYVDENAFFSFSGGYVHNSITESHNAGNGFSNGGVVTLYGTGNLYGGYLEGGMLFGYNHFKMRRKVEFGGVAPFRATAKSAFNNWQFMPHLSGGYDILKSWGIIEPFASLDLAIILQTAYNETGAAPLNMSIDSSVPLMLRSQVGFNFYEVWDKESFIAIFEELLSYVNKAPLNTQMKSAIVIAPFSVSSGTRGSFTVQTYDQVLNLITVGAKLFFKHKKSNVFCSASYGGEFGSGYMSNLLEGTLGVFF